MVKRTIQIFFLLSGGVLGYTFVPLLFTLLNSFISEGVIPAQEYIGAIVGVVFLFGFSQWFIRDLVKFFYKMQESLIKWPVTDLLFGTSGLIIGLLIAFLLYLPISRIPMPLIDHYFPLFLSVLLGYFGFQVGFRKRDEIMRAFSTKRLKDEFKTNHEATSTTYKILDTSVIIDGRIAEICKTGFIEGVLIVPAFVLKELQHIADSSDDLKRKRGRRGLDILKTMQDEGHVPIQISEEDFEHISEVHRKLVKLANLMDAKIISNDVNLNKVCALHEIPVLHLNGLANSLKPVVLPGEELDVKVIKDGNQSDQGVAYLEDGTMVVVEGGQSFIGSAIKVLVTSVLQKSQGTMIFAKQKILKI